MRRAIRPKLEQVPVKLQKSPTVQPIIPQTKVPADILSRFKVEDEPACSLPVCASIEEAARLYSEQYNKLFRENQELNNRLIQVIELRNSLAERYNSYKRSRCGEDYVKRKRREAKDIERTYFCPIAKCNKGYGSEGSLTHHMRLKHRDYYDSGKYEVFIQEFNDKLKKQQLEKGDFKKKNKMRDSKLTTELEIKDTPEVKIERVEEYEVRA